MEFTGCIMPQSKETKLKLSNRLPTSGLLSIVRVAVSQKSSGKST